MKKKNSRFSAVGIRSAVIVVVALIAGGCKGNETIGASPKEYPADVAYAWMDMQRRVLAGTPGILPHVSGRTYAYVGLTMYESVVPGMKAYKSISTQLNGNLILPSSVEGMEYYWPASANAALASILKDLLPHTTPALLNAIDSLESFYNVQFQTVANAQALQNSVDFGKQVANAIFEWSKSDGGHEAYKSPFSETYVPPTGSGKWVATGEFPFTQPVYPYWGNNRPFIPGLTDATQPGLPPEYSEVSGSNFHAAASEIYSMSQNLSLKDSLTAKFWAYEPLHPDDHHEYEDTGHAVNIATQIMIQKEFSLYEAALLYCKHGMAGNEAGISCVRAKFNYNVVRPITYIRTVLGHPDWKPVIPTPPFPEFTSGHSTVSTAYAMILENEFGKNFAFTDKTFEKTYGPRSFDSFEAYANEAGMSRLLGGIHYRFGMEEGFKQGKKIAEKVLQLNFKK